MSKASYLALVRLFPLASREHLAAVWPPGSAS